MKKVIYRVKATGKISHDGDYDEYLRCCNRMSEEEFAEMITEFNRNHENLFAEIVELDDVAEFYAKRVEPHLNIPADVEERLREIASKITDIADEIEIERGE